MRSLVQRKGSRVPQAWLVLSDPDFHPVMSKLTGWSLVVFGSRACGSCRAMRRAIGELPSGIVERMVDVDAELAPGLIDELEIFHLPALFLWCDGEDWAELTSPPRVAELVQCIQSAKQGPCRD